MVVFGAGRTGFEPAVLVAKHNRLAGGPNRPLWHLPIFIEIIYTSDGGRGIRTPGDAKRHNGFQDHRHRPLGHPSINLEYNYSVCN